MPNVIHTNLHDLARVKVLEFLIFQCEIRLGLVSAHPAFNTAPARVIGLYDISNQAVADKLDELKAELKQLNTVED